jgi:hypothetical protein
MGTPLVIDDEVRSQIKACVELAEANPVDMPRMMVEIINPVKKEHHSAQMTRQSVKIPFAYLVTFSIEHGHPCGPCRHMSMSVQREGRVPNPIAVWMIAKEFGFWGDRVECCDGMWMEDLVGHGKAINLVQRIKEPKE